MRMIIAEVYKYSELSEEAKVQAVESWSEEIMLSGACALKDLLEEDNEVFDENGFVLTIYDL